MDFKPVDYLHSVSGSAPEHMAWDEYFLDRASEEGDSYLRLMEFEEPAMVLARRTSSEDIEKALESGFDVARRETPGSTIPCLDNGLAYSVITSTSLKPDELYSQHIGPVLKQSLSEFVDEELLSVGPDYHTVRYGDSENPGDIEPGYTLAGNSLWEKGDAVLCHGVIAIEPWDYEVVESGLELRDGEKRFIEQLPSVSELSDIDETEVAYELVEGFTAGEYSEVSPEISNIADLLSAKYVDQSRIDSVRGEKYNQGHCFVELEGGSFF